MAKNTEPKIQFRSILPKMIMVMTRGVGGGGGAVPPPGFFHCKKLKFQLKLKFLCYYLILS